MKTKKFSPNQSDPAEAVEQKRFASSLNYAFVFLANRMAASRWFSVSFLLMTLTLLLQGCVGIAVRQYQRDISSHTPLSLLNLKVPTGEAKKPETIYTVAFVATRYETAMAEMVRIQIEQIQAMNRARGHTISGGYRRMDVAKPGYFEQVKKFLQTDLEQILLAKNIHVLGLFKTRDEMTFDEKKRAVYAFTPEISITVDTKSTSTDGPPYAEEGQIIVNGIMTLTLSESMTGEKLWVKRIDAEPIAKPYRFVAKYKETYHVEETLGLAGVPLGSGKTEEKDDTDQVLAQALSDFYNALGNKLWAHIDSEEWSKYLAQAEGIRKEKRF